MKTIYFVKNYLFQNTIRYIIYAPYSGFLSITADHLSPKKPEGSRITVNKAILLDLRSQPSVSTSINITHPPNIVNDSKAIQVSVIGRHLLAENVSNI